MSTTPKKRRSGRPRRGTAARTPQHASVPTSRVAYAETRRWLLQQHGPTCAYCGRTSPLRDITLDHVTPRKGQTAYDRRDNLVLCCKRCNSAKGDKAFLTYLLAQRSRADSLLKYGQHLSAGILDIVRHMAVDAPTASPQKGARQRVFYGAGEEDESPYAEPSPYRMTA